MTRSLLVLTIPLILKTSNAVDMPPPQYMGCFGDAAERAMGANGYYSHANMTIQMCVDKCSHDGYAFAGLEVGTECFCDNDYTRWGELPQSKCPTKCKGATDEECGGAWALSVYAIDSSVPVQPLPLLPLHTPVDCVADDANNRAMTRVEMPWIEGPVYVERCLDECFRLGYDFAGLQNGNECWCGDSTYDKNGSLDAATKCNKVCIGECGGVGALTVYDTAQSDYQFPSAAPSTYHASWAERRKLACVLDTYDRAMEVGPKNIYHVNSPNGMTVQACITYCEGLHFAYAGLENRNECFCGNEYRTHGFAPVTDCKHKCGGDQSQECGGAWRVTVYATGSGPFTPLPGQPSIPNLGCWADDANDRAMTLISETDLKGPVYVQRCINYCFTQGHNFAGLQNGRDCYCADNEADYQKHGTSTGCNRECGGVAYGNCGGADALKVYSVDEHNVDTRFARPATGNCIATAWGDPHIITFDGLKYDVHVMSEMIFLKSQSTDFVLQARLEPVYTLTWSSKPAVTTGIVIKGANDNLPTVQISLVPPGQTGQKVSTIRQECNVEFFVDSVAYGLNEVLGTNDVHVRLSGSMIHVSYPSQKLQLDMKVVVWQNVCHFTIDYVLLDCANNNDYVGLLGSPDGDKANDWMDGNNTPLTVPSVSGGYMFQPAYDYAIDNWCIGNPLDSYFTYPYDNLNFFNYTNCLEPFDPAFEAALTAAENDPNNEKCNGDLGCILDTVALGDDAGDAYLNEPAILNTITAEIIDSPPAPTPAPVPLPTPVPTEGPTSGPTSPTSGPTSGPTSAPVASPTRNESNNAGSNGDPHFKSWNGEHFEFHGQCDLVLAKDPEFAGGLGLDVQIRTKLVRYWSYIKSAAIRIGEDILEVQGSPETDDIGSVYFWYNLEYHGKMDTIDGFPVSVRIDNGPRRKHMFEIDLSSRYPGQKILIDTMKEFVKVSFINPGVDAFGNTVGILGDFATGKTFARDHMTVLNDFNELGNEWQVLPADDMLFHDISFPQFPQRCVLPEDPQGQRRHLVEGRISEEQAEAACAQVQDPLDRKDCVYDILATQDVDMAGAY